MSLLFAKKSCQWAVAADGELALGKSFVCPSGKAAAAAEKPRCSVLESLCIAIVAIAAVVD